MGWECPHTSAYYCSECEITTSEEKCPVCKLREELNEVGNLLADVTSELYDYVYTGVSSWDDGDYEYCCSECCCRNGEHDKTCTQGPVILAATAYLQRTAGATDDGQDEGSDG